MSNRSRLTASEAAARTRLAILEAQEREQRLAAAEQAERERAREERVRNAAAYVGRNLASAIDGVDSLIQAAIARGDGSVVYQKYIELAREEKRAGRTSRVEAHSPGYIEEQTLCAEGLVRAVQDDYEQRGFAVEELFIPNDMVTIYGSGSDPIDVREPVVQHVAIQISWPEVAVSGGAEN